MLDPGQAAPAQEAPVQEALAPPLTPPIHGEEQTSSDESPPLPRLLSHIQGRPFDRNIEKDLYYEVGTREMVEKLKINELNAGILKSFLKLSGAAVPEDSEDNFPILLALSVDVLIDKFGDEVAIDWPRICQICCRREVVFTGCLLHFGVCAICAPTSNGLLQCLICMQMLKTKETEILTAAKEGKATFSLTNEEGIRVYVWPKTRLESKRKAECKLLARGHLDSFGIEFFVDFAALNFPRLKVKFHGFHDRGLKFTRLAVLICSPPRCRGCHETGNLVCTFCHHFYHCLGCIERNEMKCPQCSEDVEEGGFLKMEHISLAPIS